MKRLTFSLLFLVMAVVVFGSWSWAITCPEAPNDNGICDTLRVTCPDAVQTPGTGPWFVRFPLWITHDVPDPVIDSIAAMVIPLCYSHTNPTVFCSTSVYWNNAIASQICTNPRSIFRELIIGTDTTHNWMRDLCLEGNGEEWNSVILDLSSANPGHFWLSLVPTGSEDRRFGPGNHVLIAMMTFRIQDTMHVSIDTCLWTPSSNLAFSRSDAQTYVPRDNLPRSFWIGPPRLQVLSPNGGEEWGQGTLHNITWLSENFTGGSVKIELSTNNGGAWSTLAASTPDTGAYPWTVPSTPSNLCLIRITNAGGATPTDQSDAVFKIIAPDFSLAATPDTQTVVAGDSTNYTVTLGALNGFSNQVTLSMNVIEASTGITSVFSSNPVTPPATPTMKIKTTGATVPATYHLVVTGTYSSLVHKDTVALIVNPAPDFTIAANPDTQQVIAGNGVNYNVILLSQHGFSSPCTLTTSGLPAGATAGFNPNPATPSDTSIMTVNTTLHVTPAGTYKITITATQQSKIQKSTDVYLVVKIPDFTVDATPETLAIRQGEQGNYNVALTALNSFSSPCTLTVSGLPANVTGGFTPAQLTPPGASTLTITAGLTAVIGKYPLIITGTEMLAKSSVLSHSDTVLLDLRSTKDFDLAVTPETLKVEVGEDSSYKIKLTSISGFSSQCSLSVSSFPANVTGVFSSHILVPTDSTLLNVMVSCNANTTVTPFALTITATELAKGIQKTQQVYLSIVEGFWGFKFATSPDSVGAVVGDSAIYQILIRRTTCFTLPCSLSMESGLPSGAFCYFSPPVIPSSDSTSKLVVQSGTAPAGISKLIVKGVPTAKGIKDTLTLALQDFDVSSSPDTAFITQGQSAGYNIIVNSLFGFAERCTLMVSGLPNNSNGVFDKQTLIPTDNSFFSIYTEPSTDSGWYNINVTARRMTAKSIALEHSHVIVLRVNESSDVATGTDNPNVPQTFTLFQNQPNPFNPTTQISYYLPKACHAKLTIYNVLGQSVRVLYDGYQEAGLQTVTWDGKNSDGVDLSSGIYFYRLQAGDFNQTRKMSLMK
jgi:hypothetical protein